MTSEDFSESSNWRSSSWSFACNIILFIVIVIVIIVSNMRGKYEQHQKAPLGPLHVPPLPATSRGENNTSKTTSGDNQQNNHTAQ